MATTAATRVAAVQMVSTPDIADNLATARRLVADAARQGAGLVLLPEYWPIMGRKETDKVGHAEEVGAGPIQETMAAMAREHGIWLVGGTLPVVAPVDGKVLNTMLVYAPDGTREARYDKIHLFSFRRGDEAYDEARTIVHGSEVRTVETPFGRIGLSVCYDLRFPELYRAMGDCSLIVMPAAFTYTTGRAHWEILLRARAVENQCYVLASAQGGIHPNGRRTWGHSMLVDPWGEVKAVLPEGEGVILGDLDPAEIQRVRESLPALQHRKL
ncbi:carbon-nitrogen hydrolase family protein [Noviherbaspirillum galbum]|uniref:Carbon-nitrogen hydrolase family protein n=1 Tax=Noviherbaspirillum galbum TaxID=2709383 RepID=A0A6B3SMC3_9BURK|nr:carbon-nitrogen hydrolase family protein [Noviherbaspirillum galbum]NEX62004.1 carbon-nitrogen hydrolase family protein [Noviherbaspirillum galbum]